MPVSCDRPSPIGRFRFLGAGLLLLALWVQALAPVAALHAMSAAADPLRDAIICGHGKAEDASLSLEQPAPSPACALCRLCCAGIAMPTLPGCAPGRRKPALARRVVADAAAGRAEPRRPLRRPTARTPDPRLISRRFAPPRGHPLDQTS